MKDYRGIRRTLAAAALAALMAIGPVLVAPASAQTPTRVLEWDYTGVTPAIVSTYVQAVTIDGAPVTAAPTCRQKTGTTTDTTCSIPLPTLSSGAHTIIVSATLNSITTSAALQNLDLSRGPQTASSPRVVVNITINLP